MTIATNHPNISFVDLFDFCEATLSTISVAISILTGLPSISLLQLCIGTKKDTQKDQDTNKPAVSSPKRVAASATKLHSPGM